MLKRHHHQYEDLVSWECAGATLGWSGKIEVCYNVTHRCGCGKTRIERGMLLPMAPKPPRDKTGWPLDENGVRMMIATTQKAPTD